MDATAEPVRVGVLLPTREQAVTGRFAAEPLLAFAGKAEALGFDSVWVGDSLTARPRFDPFVVLAAVAAVTSRVTLGTAALTPVLRHPLIVANLIASLDHVSASRLVLGLGAGFPVPETEAEFAAVGASFGQRVGRLDESVALWRQAWRTDGAVAAEFTGRYWQVAGLDRLPPPHRPGGPPLWLAGSDTPAVTARVARYYDGWLPFLPTAQAYDQAWRAVVAACQEAGRAPGAVTAGLYATVTVDEDRDRAKAELADYVGRYYGRPLEQMAALQAYGWGSAEECARWLVGYVRAGARHVVVRIGSLDPASQLELIARDVLPAVRAAG
ncbi:luciferase family protein [Parafrankia sp. EAN1pec]|uniref:LLM class flavin-dependent oxidoreductase n=1 Tax=Parafrankia sp. (strain EAN1pec) TaxID=298653 RepID=UPI0000540ADA|nr:luciferase family protein [Frankia sp. EAN1pec]